MISATHANGAVFYTKRRSSRACIGNPKPEQETIKGTHAQETRMVLDFLPFLCTFMVLNLRVLQRDAIVGIGVTAQTAGL